MMRECWERAPEDRPTFKDLYSNVSKYIERVAGYLHLGYNPFTQDYDNGSRSKDDVKEKEHEK